MTPTTPTTPTTPIGTIIESAGQLHRWDGVRWSPVETTNVGGLMVGGPSIPTTVINIRGRSGLTDLPADTVYIGRPSKWGNPFVVGKHGTREQVLVKYEHWVRGQPELMAALGELRGRKLACWCTPLACHGDVLVRLVNEMVAGDR